MAELSAFVNSLKYQIKISISALHKKKISSVSPSFTVTEAILKCLSQGEEPGRTGRYF
jgi:hypothetical protein